MAKTSTNTEKKLFLGLGVLAVVSGIILMFEGRVLSGLPGTIVGAWLVFENAKKLSAK